jgi:hypothetical protein
VVKLADYGTADTDMIMATAMASGGGGGSSNSGGGDSAGGEETDGEGLLDAPISVGQVLCG